MELVSVQGGVTASIGFKASALRCGIKESRKEVDLALIFSEKKCNAATVFTKNKIKAACISVTQEHISDGVLQAVIVNSGNANACTGDEGIKNARRMAECVSRELKISTSDVAVCSTGVIGVRLPIEKIEESVPSLAKNLSKENHKLARLAIMTTDTQYKEYAVRFSLSGKTVTIGAMCKGSGMIHINMGTMLSFITTDCAISRGMLEKAFRKSVEQTYNCVSIDGDTSTNDTALILANGMAENEEIVSEGSDYDAFFFALNYLNTIMAKKIAADGEGASRLIECCVSGAKNFDVARSLAKSVISSNLVKAAIFGSDANWGRILCALGYSGQDFLPEKTTVSFASKKSAKKYDDESLKEKTNECNNETLQRIVVFKNGVPLNFDEDIAKKILQEEIIYIFVELDEGSASARAWGCDLTYDYVKINGDYRT